MASIWTVMSANAMAAVGALAVAALSVRRCGIAYVRGRAPLDYYHSTATTRLLPLDYYHSTTTTRPLPLDYYHSTTTTRLLPHTHTHTFAQCAF